MPLVEVEVPDPQSAEEGAVRKADGFGRAHPPLAHNGRAVLPLFVPGPNRTRRLTVPFWLNFRLLTNILYRFAL